MGTKINRPEGSAIKPRIPANWRTWSIFPLAPERIIIMSVFPSGASAINLSVILSVARLQSASIDFSYSSLENRFALSFLPVRGHFPSDHSLGRLFFALSFGRPSSLGLTSTNPLVTGSTDSYRMSVPSLWFNIPAKLALILPFSNASSIMSSTCSANSTMRFFRLGIVISSTESEIPAKVQ